MNDKTKQTSGPWRVGDAGHTIFGPPQGLPPLVIANVKRGDDARIIVRAVNSFEAMRERLKKLIVAGDAVIDSRPTKGIYGPMTLLCRELTNARAALALAEKGE